jgi:hypothetical protein
VALANTLPLPRPLRLPAERQLLRPGHAGAVYDLDFAGGGANAAAITAAGLTFARSGAAWDMTGASYATGVPRIVSGSGFLIEGARTNLVTYASDYSQAYWTKNNATLTANNVVAPDGTTTASTIAESATTGALRSSSITISAATTYTASWHVKNNNATWLRFTVSLETALTNYVRCWVNTSTGAIGSATASGGSGITASAQSSTALGGGWHRVSLTFSTASATAVFLSMNTASADQGNTRANAGSGAGIGTAWATWQAQLEVGSFASAPIPTAGGTVTRAAETCTATRSDLAHGSLVLEGAMPPGTGAGQYLWAGDDATADNRVVLYGDATNLTLVVTAATVAQGALTATRPAALATFKLACRWSTNSLAMSLNGAAVTGDVSATIPTLTTERLGHGPSAGSEWHGYIRRVRRYVRPLTDAELVMATTS